MTVFAISEAKNNAELIEECVELGYLHKDWVTLDPTWGDGRFWSNWMPDTLIPLDLDRSKSPSGLSVDFRDIRWKPKGGYDAVVFDPPYKYSGTPALGKFDERYGIQKYERWQEREALILDGIAECVRVLARRGFLLIKCQDQVCSGKVRWQTKTFSSRAEDLGCRFVDHLLLPSYRPQPKGRSQKHARRNYSSLLVMQKL